jgi:hypothetical protein
LNRGSNEPAGASGVLSRNGEGGTEVGSKRRMPERYWLVHPNGGRQLIDPRHFDLDRLAEQARQIGGRLVVEGEAIVIRTDPEAPAKREAVPGPDEPPRRFEPPISALGPLFRSRLDRVYPCLVDFEVDINTRPTTRVLGGYYKSRRLVRVYSHDRQLGRRSLEELFDTFLHEIAHHVEYTEPDSFRARECERVPGRMHSQLFWRILGELKGRWADLQQRR